MSLSGRETYRRELTELARRERGIVCLELDLGGRNHPFEESHPDRFFNMGIAELATLDIAAGLAKAGLIPFVSTFASFVALRAAEGMKLAMGYMGANIKVAASYSGVSGAWFGTTHHCLEDLAVVLSIPGIRILAPYGEEETRRAVRHAAATQGPFYIRLGRNGAYESLRLSYPDTLEGALWETEPGAFAAAAPCLVSVGEMGTELCRRARARRPDLPHAHLCALHRRSLERAVSDLRGRHEAFVVVEEHRPLGGIGSSLALLMPERRVYSHNCGESWPAEGGEHEEVLASLGFGLERLLRQIEDIKEETA